ncbi:NADH:ubiquinone oxidoreductase [uncultured Vibrio sp.]|uniref:NADH:ubiquinone oxidoreductase n=1 Tax=uncultured Vibrio sp. TaxID=114054 RepID=UPI002610D8AD|nr:NADH:ubiquinone oxidoreductase [uncultured Vibrio sp.]
MKLFFILLMSISGGVAAAEHIHSFLFGFYVAGLAVGSCYWFAFRSTRFPPLALVLLMCGFFAKVAVTVVGVSWGISNDIIQSPFVFSLSYLFFLVVVSYVLFAHRDKLTLKKRTKLVEESRRQAAAKQAAA